MAREVRNIVLGAEAKRDAGKLFRVTEMSAVDAERWGRRAFQALAKAGLDVLPDEMEGASLATVAGFGFRALASASADEIDWLMDQLMACVLYVPDPTHPEVTRGPRGTAGPMDDECIQEYGTRLRLQKEAFELSLGFSLPATPSTSTAAPTAGRA